MHFPLRAYFAVIVLLLSGQGAIAASSASTTETARLAETGQEKEGAGDKQETLAQQPKPQDERPLLPERPRDFNPMMMPGGMEPPPEALSMLPYMQQTTQYSGQLTASMRLVSILLAAGMALLLVLIFYLRGLLAQARKSADIMKVTTQLAEYNSRIAQETSEKKLRAYIFTNGAKGELSNDKSGTYSVRVEIRNFGVTPAYALSGWMTVFIDDFARAREIASLPRDAEMVQTTLPPGGVCFYYARTFHPVARELKAVAAQARAIYAYGEIRYRDIFDKEHYARFRIKCAGERNLATGSFDHCLEGNEAS